MEKFDLHDGYLTIPDRPGIGVTLDMDFVQRYLDGPEAGS
jgi:L-alanine-DL-glutamate epimerase-like enolase superfamily enzyme